MLIALSAFGNTLNAITDIPKETIHGNEIQLTYPQPKPISYFKEQNCVPSIRPEEIHTAVFRNIGRYSLLPDGSMIKIFELIYIL